ncbi:hypothetical protein D9611_008171 [Ephemerocybe angulata]|uniref:DUF6534 domain-containing protein n=1 Tax=Ephemerocybe angulata TaxID=980116 RepID=A0A8H5BZ60_9AGAR|nr:hypothetical protein D9611_008171 [Tulosesus angulatus]
MVYQVRVTPTLATMAGAQMLSGVITTMLYGVALLMILRYFSSHSRNDPLWTKALIASLGVLATLQAAFTNHQIYDYFVINNNDEAARDVMPISMPGMIACTFLTTSDEDLIDSMPPGYGKVALAIVQLGAGLVQVALMNISKTQTVMFERFVDQDILTVYLNGASAAACDILITLSLVTILRSTEVNATRRTKALLEKLVVYAINRGIVTSVFALASIFLYDFASGTLYYLIPFSSNTHVYVISVVSMLTAREGLRENMDRSFHFSDLMMNTSTQRTVDNETPQSSDVLG